MLHTYPEAKGNEPSRMAVVNTKNLCATAWGHNDGNYAVNTRSGEVSTTLDGTREDMLAIAQAICECVGADIYDPKDDADSELGA